jgi:hypothetical protein
MDARAPERTETRSGLLPSPNPLPVMRTKVSGIPFVVGVELRADRGRDGEARRHRQAEIGHLGEPRALAAEEVAHAGAALGLAAAEAIDPFGFARRFARRFWRLARRGSLAARRGLARGRRASGSLFRSGTARSRFYHEITI